MIVISVRGEVVTLVVEVLVVIAVSGSGMSGRIACGRVRGGIGGGGCYIPGCDGSDSMLWYSIWIWVYVWSSVQARAAVGVHKSWYRQGGEKRGLRSAGAVGAMVSLVENGLEAVLVKLLAGVD